jgi:flagellar protein FlaG
MTKAIMSFDIGQLTVNPVPPVRSAPPAVAVARPAAPVPAVVLDRSDVIPASPPPEVLAAVDVASERTHQLASENRELHFTRDKASGRVIIEVRTLDGELLKTIPPSRALDVMTGGAL